jgi:branched-chain amino acid transport system substrate-binding protein
MMERRMKMIFWFACVCFLASLIWTFQPGVAQKAKKEILVGGDLPLSGPMAMIGGERKWAYDQAVKDINKGGGIFVKEYGKKLPVRMVIVDDESDPGKAAAAVERLIKRTNADLLLSGETGPQAVIPGMVTAEKYHRYFHATTIWIPDFLKYNPKWTTMYFFDPMQGAATPYEIFNTLPQDQRPQKISLFMEDSSDGVILGDLMAKQAEKFGRKIDLRESMGLGAKDFSSQVIKAKSAGVDAILLFANPSDTVTLLRQMKQENFNVKYFQGWKGTWPTEFYKALGKDADYILTDGFWSEDYPFPGAKELGERYFKEQGKHSVTVGMYYALCQILWQAVEKAGTLDNAKVRQAVLANEFETVNGKVKYDEKGIALFRQPVFQWMGGKQELVYPLELTKYKVKIAPPWDKR